MEGVVNQGFWYGRRVLVTGHTGFKGAWLALWLESLGATVSGLSLPPEHPLGAYSAFRLERSIRSHHVDLRDRELVTSAVASADPQTIFHLGAQALVRRGYADPITTYAVNVLGTAHVLAAANSASSLDGVVVVTSDKVYRNTGDDRAFTEDDRLGGSDPYSSSKACAEIVAAAWRASYLALESTALATARAGNVIGGGDWGDDRLLPDVWRSLTGGSPLRLRSPWATRPWQFVLEPIFGYLLLAESLSKSPEATPSAVNFGPGPSGSRSVAAVVDRAIALWGSGRWDTETHPQPSEADTLRLDSSLAATTLGWRPILDLDSAIAWTVEWWQAEAVGGDRRELALAQIEAYDRLRAG